jgi:hypothetical protein
MEDEHLQACLDTQSMSGHYQRTMEKELINRQNNKK